MSDKNVQAQPVDESAVVVEKALSFWDSYKKPVLGILAVLVIGVGGWLGYKNMVVAPKEAKANDAIAKAQQYFAMDSMNLALNGDGASKGFLKIAKEYSGTNAGNLAGYYAGICYLNLGEYAKAEKFLKDFSSDDTYLQARAYALTGDALSEQKKFADAVDYYKKAADRNEKDESFNAEYLFRAGMLYSTELNKQSEAVAVFKKIKDEYPTTQRGLEIDKYLARLGETK